VKNKENEFKMIGKQFFFSQILKQVSFNQNEAFLERPTFTFLLPN